MSDLIGKTVSSFAEETRIRQLDHAGTEFASVTRTVIRFTDGTEHIPPYGDEGNVWGEYADDQWCATCGESIVKADGRDDWQHPFDGMRDLDHDGVPAEPTPPPARYGVVQLDSDANGEYPVLVLDGVTIRLTTGEYDGHPLVFIDTDDNATLGRLRVNVNDGPVFGYPDEGTLTADTPANPWPETDAERLRFRDWQATVLNDSTTLGFRAWLTAERKRGEACQCGEAWVGSPGHEGGPTIDYDETV